MKNKLLVFSMVILLAVSFLTVLPSVGADVVENEATCDVYINSGCPDTNYEGQQEINIESNGVKMIGLWKFDISNIPSNSTINSAFFTAYVYSLLNGADIFAVTRITSSWDNSSVTYNNRPSSNLYEFDAVDVSSEEKWYSWDITELVRGWYNGTYDNYGIYLNGTTSFYGIHLRALEYFENNPYLNITYEPPNQAPNKPTCVLPTDNQEDVSINTKLKVHVIDSDCDTMSVSFYWDDNTHIETLTNVDTDTIAVTSSLLLDYNTTYSWYAIANDSLSQTQSNTFSFTTEPIFPPNKPTCVSPTDNQEDVSINTKLKVHVIDIDDDTMTVSFYWNNDTLIETVTGIQNDSDAETSSLSLDYLTQYDWYVIANDSVFETRSDSYFTFSTSENAMPVFEHVIPRIESDGYLYMIYRHDNINISNLNILMGGYINFSVWKFNYTSQDWDSNNFIINTNDYIKVKINETDMPYLDSLISIIPQIRFEITDFENDKLNIILTSNSTGVWSVITQWINVSQGWFTCNDSNMNEYNTTYYYKLDVMDSYGNIVISNFSFITTSTEPAIPPIISDINIYIISILVLVGIGGGVYILSPKKRKR